MDDYNFYDTSNQQQQPDQQQNYYNDVQSNQPDYSLGYEQNSPFDFGNQPQPPTPNQPYQQQQQGGQLNASYQSEIGPRSTETGQNWFDQQGAWDYGYAGPRNSPDFVQRPQSEADWQNRYNWMQNNYFGNQPQQPQQASQPQGMSAWTNDPSSPINAMNGMREGMGQSPMSGAFTRPGMQMQQGQPQPQQGGQEWFDRPGVWGQGQAGPEGAPAWVTQPRTMEDWTQRYFYFKRQEEQTFNPQTDPYLIRNRMGNVIGTRPTGQPNPALGRMLPAQMRPGLPPARPLAPIRPASYAPQRASVPARPVYQQQAPRPVAPAKPVAAPAPNSQQLAAAQAAAQRQAEAQKAQAEAARAEMIRRGAGKIADWFF